MDRRAVLKSAVIPLVRIAGELARFCDRVEHSELADRGVVVRVGGEARELAISLFAAVGMDPVAAYAARIGRVEERHPLSGPNSYDGSAEIAQARTWRQLQHAQAHHDAVYHADVTGLAKVDQLRHYTFHFAKLAWLIQEASENEPEVEEFIENRLPDLLLFGVKLATVMATRLPDEAIV